MRPKHPLTFDGKFIRDADSNPVLTCSELLPDSYCQLWDAAFIDANPLFSCPNCGRIGIRMEEATGITFKQTEGIERTNT